jgi:hypothetical protein
MRTIILLGIAASMPSLAQAATPAEAAKAALQACVNHSQDIDKILETNANLLERKGYKYQRDAPESMRDTKSTAFGIAEYVSAGSSEGEIWSAGYDKGACLVVTLGADLAEVTKGYTELVGNGKWRKEKARPADADKHVERWAWGADRRYRIRAEINFRDNDGISTVMVAREFN